jgi:predicted MFS family arabinose efflux permease
VTKDDQDGADREGLRVALAALAALAIAMGIGRFAFTPILPMMQQDSGLSVSDGGWLASANYLGYLIGALSAVRLHLRAATAIRAGLAVIGASTLAMALHDGFPLWVFLRTVAGVASAWVLVFVSAWSLERLSALARLRLSGVVYAGVGTGIVVAGGTCLVAMSVGAGSSAAWTALGLASLAAAAVFWPAFGSGTFPAGAAPLRDRAKHGGEFWRLVICYGAYGFGYIIPGTFLPVMAKQVVADPSLFGWAWPVFGAAAVASTLLVARAAPLVTHRRAWAISHLVMALGVVVHHHGGRAGGARGRRRARAHAHRRDDLGLRARPDRRSLVRGVLGAGDGRVLGRADPRFGAAGALGLGATAGTRPLALAYFCRSAASSAALAPSASPRASRDCAMRRQLSATSSASLPAQELERCAQLSACT